MVHSSSASLAYDADRSLYALALWSYHQVIVVMGRVRSLVWTAMILPILHIVSHIMLTLTVLRVLNRSRVVDIHDIAQVRVILRSHWFTDVARADWTNHVLVRYILSALVRGAVLAHARIGHALGVVHVVLLIAVTHVRFLAWLRADASQSAESWALLIVMVMIVIRIAYRATALVDVLVRAQEIIIVISIGCVMAIVSSNVGLPNLIQDWSRPLGVDSRYLSHHLPIVTVGVLACFVAGASCLVWRCKVDLAHASGEDLLVILLPVLL